MAFALNSAFNSNGNQNGYVAIIQRQFSVRASSYPSEIVTCRFEDGREQRIMCKYSAGFSHNSHGHRGGVWYESEVYRHVLQGIELTLPTFHGTHRDPSTGETWIFLEYLDDAVRVTKTPDQSAMSLAARWVGQFHAANELRLADINMCFLNRYNVEFYVGWSRRTLLLAGDLLERYPWMKRIHDRYHRVVEQFLTQGVTIIHSEFYPGNVLFRAGAVYPVDWESAAIAPGEIDLASLTEKWPEIGEQCEREYKQARWPMALPDEFDDRLAAARLYLGFRWLGERAEWTTDEALSWRFDQLYSAAERLALL